MIKIIEVVAISDNNKIIVEYNNGLLNKAKFRLEGTGTLLKGLNENTFSKSMLMLGGEQCSINLTIPKDAILFNSIGLVERHTKALDQFTQILKQLSNTVINQPDNILLTSRNKIEKSLEGITDIIVPQCLTIQPVCIDDVSDFLSVNKVSYPFLFRPEIDHGADTLLRVDNVDDLQKLHRFAFDGANVFFITTFVDFISADGYYRKMRFLVIGDEVIPRHLIVSKSWQIHTEETTTQTELLTQKRYEEDVFLRQIEISVGKCMLAIKQALGLDYVGIDCAFDKYGKVIIFEANPYSMIGRGKEEALHQPTLKYINHSLLKLIKSKI